MPALRATLSEPVIVGSEAPSSARRAGLVVGGAETLRAPTSPSSRPCLGPAHARGGVSPDGQRTRSFSSLGDRGTSPRIESRGRQRRRSPERVASMTPFLAVEDKFWERDWYGTTVLHPLALVALIVLGALIFVLPRRPAVFSILVMACFVASAQRISIFGLDFALLRCLICIGWVRVFFRGEYRGFVWKPIDKLVLWWGVVGTITYVIQQQNGSAFVNRLGWLLDSTGMYFLFRSLVHHWRDFDGIVTTMIAIAVPVSLIFLVESRTGRNLFSIFGGVPEITVERVGRLLCQGDLSLAIMVC